MKDQPAPSYASRMEFAKTIGKVRPHKGHFMIDVCVNAERYKLRHLPVAGGGWIPFPLSELGQDGIVPQFEPGL